MFVPMDFENIKPKFPVTLRPVDNPELEFIKAHNELWEDSNYEPLEDDIHDTAQIHPKASIGNDGMRYVRCGEEVISMYHAGRVFIGENVVVGACSSIARATIDETIIMREVKIGCGVHIGHNCYVGSYTIIVDGVTIGGSSVIGSDCYLGLGATVRNGVKIINHTMIGAGAVVVKDILEPWGVYAGVPAKKIKDWDGEWV